MQLYACESLRGGTLTNAKWASADRMCGGASINLFLEMESAEREQLNLNITCASWVEDHMTPVEINSAGIFLKRSTQNRT